MPRKPDPTLKPAIVEKVAQHLLDTKLEDVSVRSLGRVLGTSAYPIVYHFGSRESLIQAVVDHLEADVVDLVLDPEGDTDALGRHLVTVFGGLDSPERALAARLTFELGCVESIDGRDRERRSFRRRIAEIAAWCTAHGACPDTAERTARAAVGAARGVQWGALVDPAGTDVDGALRAIALEVSVGSLAAA